MGLSEKFPVIIPPEEIAIPAETMMRLAGGDEKAFGWLYKSFSGKLNRYASMLTGNEAAAEDIIQDVFLKLWKKRRKMAMVKDPNAYLYTMIRNHVKDHWRARERDGIYKKRQMEVSRPAYSRPPDEKELAGIIHDAVSNLPPRQKLVYRLRKEERLKGAEIAEALDISPCTVKIHINQASRIVKEYVRVRWMEN